VASGVLVYVSAGQTQTASVVKRSAVVHVLPNVIERG